MPFRHSCFISYRHPDSELLTAMVNDFYNALSGELEVLVGKGTIYRDRENLKPGDDFPKALAKAIHESVCMVVLYTEHYFDRTNTFCTREFKAMQKLEKERIKRLPKSKQIHGLIIPIIFRGGKYMPEEIKTNRHCADFENYFLCDPKMNRHPRYAPEIKKIAEHIYECGNMFSGIKKELFSDDLELPIPSEAEVLPWLEKIKKNTLAFPGL